MPGVAALGNVPGDEEGLHFPVVFGDRDLGQFPVVCPGVEGRRHQAPEVLGAGADP